jgi:Cu(I)/Ag(I) efflux system membrane fusion protein
MRTWLVVLAGLLAGALPVALTPAAWWFVPATVASAAPTGERWACAMLDFVGDHPGTCPVCGMTLQRVVAGELTKEQARRMGVEVVTVAEGPAAVTIHAYGAARYDDRTAVAVIPRVSGRIVARHAGARHAGVEVAVGDPLVDLYSPDVLAAQAELVAARASGDAQTIASVRLRFTRWNLDPVAEAVLAGGAPVDTVTIRAPAAGRVLMDEGAGEPVVGQAISADQPLLRLVDPQAFMVVVHVPEPRARLLRHGAPVALASDDAGPLPDVEASISWIAPELDPEIRTRAIHLHLRDPHHRLLPGSLVEARIRTALGPDGEAADPADEATWGRFPLVPAAAVLSTGVRHVAWRLEATDADGRQHFAPVPLALGQRLEDADGNDRYVVRAGLKAGDRVAAQGAFLIDSQAQLAGTPSLLFPTGAP